MQRILAILATLIVFIASVLGVSALNWASMPDPSYFATLVTPAIGEFRGRVTGVDVERSLVIAAGTVRFTDGPPQIIARDLPAQIGLAFERTSAGRRRLTGEGILILRAELSSGRPVSLTARLHDLKLTLERFELGTDVSVPLITEEFWGPRPDTSDPGRATLDRLSTDFSDSMLATLEHVLDVTLEPGDILTELAMTDLPSPTPGEGGPNPDEPGGGGSGPPIVTPRPPNS